MPAYSTDLNLIPVFIAVMEEQNLSRAAERLKITQPAVSQALRKLRDSYDDELFIRTSNGVHPTMVAQDIYPALQDAYRQISQTLPDQRTFDPAASKRHFSIAALSIVNYTLMPGLAIRLQQLAPEVTLEIHPLFSTDPAQDLRIRKFDMTIDLHRLETCSVQQQLVMEDSLTVICAKKHPRITDTLSEEQYLEEKHVIHTFNSPDSNSLDISHLEAAGIHEIKGRKVAWKAPGILEILPIVAYSDWLATIPTGIANRYAQNNQIKCFKPDFHTGTLPIYMSWHPSLDSDKAHQWLRDLLLSVAQELI